jgi:hypothetical protein
MNRQTIDKVSRKVTIDRKQRPLDRYGAKGIDVTRESLLFFDRMDEMIG